MNNIQVDALNLMAEDPKELIDHSENAYQQQISRIASEIIQRPAKERIVLLSGPSASGKTWSARLLCNQLDASGTNSLLISLDRFYKERDLNAPSNLQPDIESVDALDKQALLRCIQGLQQKQRTKLPHYSFSSGQIDRMDQVFLPENGCLIFEGIHALNPSLLPESIFSKAVCVAVNVQTSFNSSSGEQVLNPKDLRLARRILRDLRHRDASPEHTIRLWKHVIQSERQFILPFFHRANFHMDSTHSYEPLLYGAMLSPVLPKSADPEIQETSDRLLRSLSAFAHISADLVPDQSLLTEFIR